MQILTSVTRHLLKCALSQTRNYTVAWHNFSSYYASIMLDVCRHPLCSNLCWHNRLVPNKVEFQGVWGWNPQMLQDFCNLKRFENSAMPIYTATLPQDYKKYFSAAPPPPPPPPLESPMDDNTQLQIILRSILLDFCVTCNIIRYGSIGSCMRLGLSYLRTRNANQSPG